MNEATSAIEKEKSEQIIGQLRDAVIEVAPGGATAEDDAGMRSESTHLLSLTSGGLALLDPGLARRMKSYRGILLDECLVSVLAESKPIFP